MKIKGLIDEDFVNYKKPSMVIMFPKCSFKCDKDCGEQVCQNSILATSTEIDIDEKELIKRYLQNSLTSAIVCSGLEPFDSFQDLENLIKITRYDYHCNDDIVIYTGYNKEEIKDKIETLSSYENIIIKFGRFIPHQNFHYDEVLGIKLASDNQYGEKI